MLAKKYTTVSRRDLIKAAASFPIVAALVSIMPAPKAEAAAPKTVPPSEPAPGRPLAELKHRIEALDHAHLVALGLILDAIDEAKGDRAREAALNKKLAVWFRIQEAGQPLLEDLIAEWRTEGEPEPIIA